MSAKKDEHFEALATDTSHVAGEDSGCVTRCVYEEAGGKRKCRFDGHDYKSNGFNYQQGCGEAAWYNLPIHEKDSDARRRFDAAFTTAFKQEWRDPSKRAEAWHMGAGPYGHINFIASGHWPWPNNAHHLIPVDDVLSKVLDFDQRKLLQQAKYNVNKGINILYLPNRVQHATLFQLLRHPRYHSTYSKDVRNRVTAIREQLEEAADEEQEGHPQFEEKTIGKLGDQLHAFSGRLRKQIRAAGIKRPGAHLNELASLVTIR
ncbi:hypothetical protein G4177_09360 [Corallococcus sp. ZKHCc1 1396]|uniref:Uncharacterized protein n=1 Tax=Corallococcus soli TaxID=2710757 RepID=A0ABR9PKH8_9BACT|nr:AHH domain-containing protein [Corallococcus soli]MBE4748374.1 hypothetical protein [Corallococcus soli]